MSVFLASHNDDEALFGSFTLLRHRPLVVICLYDGEARAEESRQACAVLGCEVDQWRFTSPIPAMAEAIWKIDGQVFAPARVDGGNADHNLIADLAPADAIRYLTYTTDGKQTGGAEVAYEPGWIGLKHQALACYPSQFAQPGRAEHFLRDIREYVAA